MPGGGGGGSQTVTQQSDPWSKAQPHLERIMNEAYNIYKNEPPAQFPGLTVAQRSMPTMLAEELTLGRALGGSRLTDNARQTLTDTAGGKYLDVTQNPAFQSAMSKLSDNYNSTTAPQTDAMFARSGAFGGSAYGDAVSRNQKDLARGMGDTAASLWNTERQNQLSASQLAPSFAANDYSEIGRISAVGDQRDAYNQSLLNDAVQKYGFDANKSRQALSDYLGFVGGMGSQGQSSSSTTPMTRNTGAGLLGGGLAGFQLGSKIGGLEALSGTALGPYGGLIGAGLGAFGSLF